MPITRSAAGRNQKGTEARPPSVSTVEIPKETVCEESTRVTQEYPICYEAPPDCPSEIRKLTEKRTKQKTVSSRSDKRLRLALASEEIAKRKLELAEARRATIEAEESEDEGSVLSKESGGQSRVTEWLRRYTPTPRQPTPMPRMLDSPLPPPPPSSLQPTLVQPEREESKQMQPAPMQPMKLNPQLMPPSMKPPTACPTKNEDEKQRIDLSELASAIAMAAKPTIVTGTPKYMGELGIFNGCHTEWLSFFAMYKETAGYFTETENTARLRRALKGKAREAVDSLLISSTKPDEIIEELQMRFGRPDTIALATLQRIRNIPKLSDTPKEICMFAGRVKNNIATLKALNKKHYLYNPEIIRHLTEKLTPSLKYRWFDFARSQPTEEPDLIQFYNFATREANLCGRYADPEITSTFNQELTPPPRASFKPKIHRTYTVTEPRPCPVCKQTGHTIVTECETFKKAESNKKWEMAKQHRLCFRCLYYKSNSHRCKTRICGKENCNKTHHPMLHYKVAETEQKEKEIVITTNSKKTIRSYLKMVPVEVVGPQSTIHTYALLDDGSTVTLIDENIAIQVGAEGPIDPLNIEAIAGTTLTRESSRRVTLKLRGQNTEHEVIARTMKDLKLATQTITEDDIKTYKHLEDVITNFEEAHPTILIGQDNWEMLIASEVRRGTSKEPVASLTPLGWVIHGSTTRSLGHQIHHVYLLKEEEDRIEDIVKKHFAIESLGVLPKQTRSDPDELALKILQENTKENPEGGYSTSLLWKTETVELPNNYDYALSRLQSTEKKIDKIPELKEEYEKQINQLIEKGYAEVIKNPKQSKPGRTWYLPHFPVLHPSKPGKVRPVFDAAARAKGTSLNEHLLTGPDFLKSLAGVLMRFRQHPIAVAADIQEMFLRIQIREEDRDALRFLWRSHRREGSPTEYRMKTVIFGAASSPCTALFIKNHNAEKYREKFPEAAEAIVNHHYMDDYLQSFEKIDEAIRITEEVRLIHEKANFILRKWTSNNEELLKQHDTVDSNETRDVTLEGDTNGKILGMIWNTKTDTLSFNLNFARVCPNVVEEGTPTKRETLRMVMSLFDPLGLTSPVTIQGKKILQEIWRDGTQWDDKIPSRLLPKWKEWLQDLKKLKDVKLPRCHPKFSKTEKRELHTFVDASEDAYAAAVYWRTEDSVGQVTITLAAARARVAPLKLISIPRLELQAAVLGSRLSVYVQQEYEVKADQHFYWTDSKTVLAWLRAGARTFKPFVAHRIAEIEENSKINEWRWVPSRLNVADDATRKTPTDFNEDHRWFIGPTFLYEPINEWPQEKIEKTETITTGEERVHLTRQKTEIKLSEALPKIERFSSWLRLIRTTARVIQFIEILRKKKTTNTEVANYRRTSRNKEDDPTWKTKKKIQKEVRIHKTFNTIDTFIPIEASDIRKAEQLWIRSSQEESFIEDIEKLRRNETVTKESRLRQLSVIYDHGPNIIRLKSRIAAASEISEQQKSPPILDGNHRYTKLYIDWIHRKLHHGGIEMVMNETRQHFWILRGRTIIRSIVKQCLKCRIRRAKAPEPPTGDLPYCRLAHHQRPFTYTGLDYFGPLSVTVGRQHQKRYVALFTCLTTRAIHLEIAANLSTDSAILALRRMMARRGQPVEIWSDNGTNLRGADAELRKAILEACEKEAANRSIQWRFIPPSAPFMGGAWERLVRSVKTALSTTLHERHPQEEILATLLCEVEYTVNSRPLTHISVDPEDDEALTPNHFLLGGSGNLKQPGTFTEEDITSRNHWRRAQRLADEFWNRWVREYLPGLQYRREPHGNGESLNIGDLVLVADSNLPRNTWPRGKVIQVYPGQDGIVRTADIKTRNGILRRPAKKLVVLPTATVVPTERLEL